jgi:hypothetical protein
MDIHEKHRPEIRRRLVAVVVLLLAGTAFVALTRQGGDPSLWLQDFDILKHEMARGYANLEWSAAHQGLDLARLSRETEQRLSATSSRGKARRIVEEFLESFADPHLRAEPAEPPTAREGGNGSWTGPPATASAKEALRSFGYGKGDYDFGLRVDTLPGFEPITADGDPFPAGLLALEDGRKIGALRIRYFGEDRYYDDAAETWDAFRGGIEGTCGSGCWWRFTLAVRSRLLSRLQSQLEELQKAGIDALLVDITGNGGGSEWCEDVARLLTPKRLRLTQGQFIKHAHWERQIEKEIGWLEEDLARRDLPPELQQQIQVALGEHQTLLDDVRTGCDGSSIWNGVAPPCRRLAADPHGQFEIPDSAEPLAATLAAEHILFQPVRHPDFIGAYDGPLFIAIDHGTASAAEQFATLLQAGEAAAILGEPSFGAGCGYTRGGIYLYLEHLGLRVRMPDCMRTRADGENELAGVQPDEAGWPRGARGQARVRELIAAIESVLPG